MLSSFDWIRRCATGAELLATLEYFTILPDLFDNQLDLAAPFAADADVCQRCWTYSMGWQAPESSSKKRLSPQYCQACALVMEKAAELGRTSRHSSVIWGFVNQIPRHLEAGEGFYRKHAHGWYVQDAHHFLLLLDRRNLQDWLQELALYHGSDLKGLLQIFPTTGSGRGFSMGELLCRAILHEARFAMNALRIRFFSAPHQLLRPHVRDQKGVLTFDVSDFVGLLEMASIFRTLIRPNEQQMLYELLHITKPAEKQFYWGRFLGFVSQEARDMITAWNIRQWPEPRLQFFYELFEYVEFDQHP